MIFNDSNLSLSFGQKLPLLHMDFFWSHVQCIDTYVQNRKIYWLKIVNFIDGFRKKVWLFCLLLLTNHNNCCCSVCAIVKTFFVRVWERVKWKYCFGEPMQNSIQFNSMNPFIQYCPPIRSELTQQWHDFSVWIKYISSM